MVVAAQAEHEKWDSAHHQQLRAPAWAAELLRAWWPARQAGRISGIL